MIKGDLTMIFLVAVIKRAEAIMAIRKRVAISHRLHLLAKILWWWVVVPSFWGLVSKGIPFLFIHKK